MRLWINFILKFLKTNNNLVGGWGDLAALEETMNEQEYESAATAANELTNSLGIDAAVRIIAKSGRSHDRGPNWYVEWGEMAFSATFGAGTNSASVSVSNMDISTNHMLLYSADDYGRYVRVFRHGPWVNRLLAYADELRHANKVKAQEIEAAKLAARLDSFKEVDF
jgi:hypothetical protein